MEQSLAEFVKGAWHVLEPETPLIWNWHLDVICAYVQALYEGKIGPYLAINVPPGTMKSTIVSVCAPAWVWTRMPGYRFLCGTNTQDLSHRDAEAHRSLIESDWYQSRWGFKKVEGEKEVWSQLDPRNRGSSMFMTTRRGRRQSLGMLGSVTGKRGNALNVDDPHDTENIESDIQRLAVLNRWKNAWSNRLNDLEHGPRCLIMQRQHMQDMTAQWEELYGPDGSGDLVHLVIPMRYEADVGPRYDPVKDLGRPDLVDPRSEEGELMFPERFPESAVRRQEIELGPYGTAGQLQQRPSPKGGGEFRREWLSHYQTAPRGGNRYIIVDPAGERTVKNVKQKRDNTAMGVIECCEDQNAYLIDAYRDRLNLTERAEIVMKWHRKYRPLGVGYEKDGFASDIAHLRDLQERTGYRFHITPLGGKGIVKEQRIRTLLPWFQNRRLWLPETLHRTLFDGQTVDLIEMFVEQEYLPFPVAQFDDFLDMLSRITDEDLNIQFPTPRKPRRASSGGMGDASMGY